MSEFRNTCLKLLKESDHVTLQLDELTNGQETYFFIVGGNSFNMQVDDYLVIYYDKEGGQTDYTYHSFDEMCKEWISLKNKGFKEVKK